MARLFDTHGQRLEATSAIASGTYPVTIAGWARPGSITDDHFWFGVISASGDVTYNGVWVYDSKVVAATYNGTGTYVESSGHDLTGQTDQWHHFLAQFSAADNRQMFLAGSGDTAETTSRTPAWDNLTAGGSREGDTFTVDTGRLASLAMWNVVLSADEKAALAAKVSPAQIRPTSLKGHWDLQGIFDPEIDYTAEANSLTLVSSPGRADHAPVALWVPGFSPTETSGLAAQPASSLATLGVG